MKTNIKNITEVEINGEFYKIVNDASQEYTKSLAKYVDEKLKEISPSSSMVSPMKVAILAALNITDELFKLKIELEAEKEIVEKETDSLYRLIYDNTKV